MSRPKINTSPVAGRYDNPHEKRVEFSGAYGGGLVLFVNDDERQQTRVEVYRQDPAVEVTVSGHDVARKSSDGQPPEASVAELALAAVLDYVTDCAMAGLASVSVRDLVASIDARVSSDARDAVAEWRQIPE